MLLEGNTQEDGKNYKSGCFQALIKILRDAFTKCHLICSSTLRTVIKTIDILQN